MPGGEAGDGIAGDGIAGEGIAGEGIAGEGITGGKTRFLDRSLCREFSGYQAVDLLV